VSFVSGGKGFLGVHSDGHAPQWPDYGRLVGLFQEHPWTQPATVIVRIRHRHGLIRRSVTLNDEFYTFETIRAPAHGTPSADPGLSDRWRYPTA
jgi:hypothetical protein